MAQSIKYTHTHTHTQQQQQQNPGQGILYRNNNNRNNDQKTGEWQEIEWKPVLIDSVSKRHGLPFTQVQWEDTGECEARKW